MNLIFKADDPHETAKNNFKQFLEEESVPMRRAFQNFVQSMLDDVSDAQIRSWIENKDLKGFLKFTADYVDEMSDVLPKTFTRAAQAEIADLSQPGKFGVGKLAIEFDPGASSAADLIESSRLQFLRDFTKSQKDAVRSAISDALSSGEGPAAAARRFRSSIGLTENQYRAVQNYQAALENGSRSALGRSLRDARFDRTIERTIANDDVLSAKQIERMVGRYTENMRDYRAMTIARTETMRTLNQAKQAAWAQTAKELGIKPSKVEKTWITTLDGKERDTHHDMNRQTVVGLETPFESPSGEELVYPGDPSASAEETVQCRCTVVVRFPPPSRMIGKAYNPDEPRDKDGKWTARPAGWNAGGDDVKAITRPGHYYRGMSEAEYDATLGAGKGVKSNLSSSIASVEGTNFADNAADAESYANYGRDDPRKTGKPTYLVEVTGGDDIKPKRDGYFHSQGEIPTSRVTRVWRMAAEGDAVIATKVKLKKP